VGDWHVGAAETQDPVAKRVCGAAESWAWPEMNSGKKIKFGFRTGLKLICSKRGLLELKRIEIKYWELGVKCETTFVIAMFPDSNSNLN
jgi:hypothetical protein